MCSHRIAIISLKDLSEIIWIKTLGRNGEGVVALSGIVSNRCIAYPAFKIGSVQLFSISSAVSNTYTYIFLHIFI